MPNQSMLSDGDDRFLRMNTRLRPSQLKNGEVALSENGRFEESGAWKVREGYENVSGVTLSTANTAILTDEDGEGAIVLIAASAGSDTASITSNVVTVTVAAGHGIPSTPSITWTINLSGFAAAGSGEDINGNRTVTRTGTTTFTFSLTSANDSYTNGTVGAVKLNEDTIAIRGACLFSDPADSNSDYIIIADNAQATAVKVSTLAKTNIAYPSGEALTQDCDLLQEFHKVVLRQNGKTAWELASFFESLSATAAVASNVVTVTTASEHGLSSKRASVVNLSGFTAAASGADMNGIKTVTWASSTTFTFALTSADDNYTGGTVDPAFAKVGSGAKTQHSIFDATGNTAISSGVATVTATSHGITQDTSYTAGVDPPRKVLIVDSEDYDFLDGLTVEVATVDDADTFTFKVNAEDNASTSIVYSTEASLGGAYLNMPGAPWGVYHQRRSWLPYTHTDAATPADRNVRDEIIASDILDNSTYDPIGNQFRISGGASDFVVGMHGFDDDRMLVFNRNSIHYLKGVSGSLSDVETIQLTSEIGCIARKSIVSYANQVFFLSDSGVYAISFIDEYNLRGVELPLSEAVDSIIMRITPGSADKAIAKYHHHRLWFAIPIDGSTGNNALLVYNFLGGGWESIDTVSADVPTWDIIELVEAKSGKMNELYAVTSLGGVHQVSETDLDVDRLAASVGQASDTDFAIPAALTTRQYAFGNLRRKKFNRLRVALKSDDDHVTHGDMSLIVEDPDATIDLGEVRDHFSGGLAQGETGTVMTRTGNPRGFAAQFKYDTESGRPEVLSVQVDAVPSFESTTSAS